MVSLVINGRADGKIKISKATQKRVLDSVRRLDYVPNVAARRLAGGRNRLIGVFTYEPIFPMETSSFYFPILVGVEEGAETENYDLVLFTSSSQPDGRRRIYRDGVNALELADGAILLGSHEDRDELLRLHQSGYPFVYVGRREIDGKELPSVGADYATASEEVIRLLHRHGHANIIYLAASGCNESSMDRERGVRQASLDAGVELTDDRIMRVPIDDLDIAHVRDWIKRGATAVIVDHLPIALRLKEIAVTMELTIPGDLSIAALGNSGDPAYDLFGITTFLIPRREMATRAVARLVDKLEGRQPEPDQPLLLPCTMFEGTTVGAPRGKTTVSVRSLPIRKGEKNSKLWCR